jgi:quinol monooxygenase YgiN
MNNQIVRFTVDLTINAEKFDKFESIVQAMLAATRNEPGTLGYDWCLSADRTRCRLLETYADANAVMAHMTGPAVRELVPKLLEVSSFSSFEVYGDPGPEAAQVPARFKAEIFELWQGLSR